MTIISHQHKFIILLNPKCAASSIQQTLSKYNQKQKSDIREGRRALHNSLKDLTFDYDEYFTAIFVRNPWDRIISYYKYVVEKSSKHPHHHQMRCQSFQQFVRTPSNALLSQCSTRAKGVKWVGRFENLTKDFTNLCNLCGIWDETSRQLLHGNSTDRKKNDFDEYFTSQDLIDLVAEYYKTDIELYGYKFPNKKENTNE